MYSVVFKYEQEKIESRRPVIRDICLVLRRFNMITALMMMIINIMMSTVTTIK